MSPRRVLFFGSSMLLLLVAESLEQRPDLRVTRAKTWAEAARALANGIPEALIFDLSQDHESHILPLLLKKPNLLLIGLNPECNQAVLLTGKEVRSLTINQLAQIVRREEPLSTVISSGEDMPSSLPIPTAKRTDRSMSEAADGSQEDQP